MYKYIFGPVPSRRLGVSLGVDLVPLKVCSLNCVYCECGETTTLTAERKEYVPYKGVISELHDFMKNNPCPDYITFSGSGEPALNSRIGDIIDTIKKNYPDVLTAVLTNATLLSDKQVRKELLKADLVLPSVDAVSDKIFQKINRPDPSIDIEKYLDGMISFRKEFSGKIWLEVFILPGYNDSSAELAKMKKVLLKISPDLIQLNTLDRPGAVEGLKPASRRQLESIRDEWGMDNVEIVAKVSSRKDRRSFDKDIEGTILETVSRRPCTLQDIINITGLHANEINKYLDTLESSEKIESIRQQRGVFYKLRK